MRLDKSIKIGVQIAPVVPFIGESLEAGLLNLSAGGLALAVREPAHLPPKGAELRIHFRLPGKLLLQCRGKIHRISETPSNEIVLGIKFDKVPAGIVRELNHMCEDDAACDRRIQNNGHPWCDPFCSFRSLCAKPARVDENPVLRPERFPFEIALQQMEKISTIP